MTHPPKNRCTFTEGSIVLPDGCREQTVNILLPGNGTSLNISRDIMRPDENFASWLDRQRGLLQKGLRKYSLFDEQPALLGEGAIAGISMHSRYRSQKEGFLFQRHAAFPLSTSGVLIFTLAASAPLTERDEHFLTVCLVLPDSMIAGADDDYCDMKFSDADG